MWRKAYDAVARGCHLGFGRRDVVARGAPHGFALSAAEGLEGVVADATFHAHRVFGRLFGGATRAARVVHDDPGVAFLAVPRVYEGGVGAPRTHVRWGKWVFKIVGVRRQCGPVGLTRILRCGVGSRCGGWRCGWHHHRVLAHRGEKLRCVKLVNGNFETWMRRCFHSKGVLLPYHHAPHHTISFSAYGHHQPHTTNPPCHTTILLKDNPQPPHLPPPLKIYLHSPPQSQLYP